MCNPMMMSRINQTQIKTALPYCLYKVDSRFFRIGDEFNSKIRFVKVETTPNRRIAFSQNMETIRDRWGIDAHSKVEISTDKTFRVDDTKEAKQFALKIINDFVRRYRHFDRDSLHLVVLSEEDLFGFLVLGEQGKGVFSPSLAGGIQATDPLLMHQISNEIEQSLINNEIIPFHKDLLMNAAEHIYQGNYRHSILESVIALELVVSRFIVIRCKAKSIGKEEMEQFIHNVGIKGNIGVMVKALVESKNMPEEKVFEKCKGGISIRNDIVHEGRQNVLEQEAKDTLVYARRLINFLVPFLS